MCLVIIDGVNSALVAARVSAETGRALVLHSPPNAAAYLGASVFRQIIDAAKLQHPKAQIEGCLDCGDAPGFALNALRQGARLIRFNGPGADQIRNIADQLGARLVAGPFPSHAPDLSCIEDPETFLRGEILEPRR